MDEKTQTTSLFNNSEKLVQILLEFSQHIVEHYEFVVAKFHWKRPFQSTQICNLSQTKGNHLTFWPYFTLCTKCDRSILCKIFRRHCFSLRSLKSVSSEQHWHLHFCTRYFYRILYTNVKYGQKVHPLFGFHIGVNSNSRWQTLRIWWQKNNKISHSQMGLLGLKPSLSKISHRQYHFESLKQYVHSDLTTICLSVRSHPKDQGWLWTKFNSNYFRM